MSDEGFHEIQLNGKQLVFLFMAATVVSVVIFLLGVMVGRGVPSSRVQAAEAAESATVDPTVMIPPPGGPSTHAERMPVSAQESLTYAERLSSPTPAPETRGEPVPPPVEAPPPAVRSTPAPAPIAEPAPRRAAEPSPAREQAAAAAPAATAANGAFAEPPGDGHVVQVGAYPLNTARTIARRLDSKGYPVFITPRPQGLFAVRVGKFSDRREAESVAGRLEQQEQFNKPWVTR